MSFFAELKRRNVLRIAIAYAASAWLIIQVVGELFPIYGLTDAHVRIVVSVLAIGFIPALILSWKFEWTPSGIVADADAPTGERGYSARMLDRAITVFLVLAVAYFAVDKFVLSESNFSGEKSIAVLPLANISNDPEQDFFGSGISIGLTNLLSSIPGLRVISSDTSGLFTDPDVDIIEAANKLDVTHIIAGAVRKAGDRVRVAVRLVRTDNNAVLWSEDYERTLDDIFAIQDDISARVVGQLRLQLSDAPPTSEQIDPRAYEMYLRGSHLSHAVRTPEAFVEAVALLEQVEEMEPAFVPGLWTLARAIVNEASDDDIAATEAAYDRIRPLVDRMVALAPDSSYANSWLAHLAEVDGEDMQVVATYRERSITDGTDATAYLQMAIGSRWLIRTGQIDEAIALLDYVLKRDPACLACTYGLAFALRQNGRHREAAERLEKLLDWREPSPGIYWSLGVAWLVEGDPEKALNYFDLDEIGIGKLGRIMALHDLGRTAEFEEEFSRLVADENTNPEGIARAAAWTGQNDIAFEYLDRAVAIHGSGVAANVMTDLYEPIKSDPRWQEFLDRNGASEQELLDIEFNPQLPPEVVAEVERVRAARARDAASSN